MSRRRNWRRPKPGTADAPCHQKGLTNVANLGIDDYSNEVFQVYANYVFDFKNIKDEMDFIKGSSSGGGRVNISKFIEGLLLYRKSLL